MAAKKATRHSKVSPAPHIADAIAALKKPASKAGSNKIGERIDALYDARERRLEVQRELNRLKACEDEAEQVVIKLLQDVGLTKGSGTHASVSLKTKLVAKVDPEHWNDVFAQIAKRKAWDLLYKRISNEAYRERLAEPFDYISTSSVLDLSLTALKKGGK